MDNRGSLFGGIYRNDNAGMPVSRSGTAPSMVSTGYTENARSLGSTGNGKAIAIMLKKSTQLFQRIKQCVAQMGYSELGLELMIPQKILSVD